MRREAGRKETQKSSIYYRGRPYRMMAKIAALKMGQIAIPSNWRTLDLSPRNPDRNSMIPLAMVSKSLILLARKF